MRGYFRQPLTRTTLQQTLTTDRVRNNRSERFICVNSPGLRPLRDGVSSRTCANAVQYESTFLTVMTPRLRRDAFKKQCYMKVNMAIKSLLRRRPARQQTPAPRRQLGRAATQPHGSASSLNILTLFLIRVNVCTFCLKRAKKKTIK